MTRTPLRPLTQIIEARARGEDPDEIERHNLHARHEAMRDQAQRSAEGRLLLLAIFFLGAFAMVALRMGSVALSEPVEPTGEVAVNAIVANRADITDRNGRILATNLSTHALYAQPQLMTDPVGSAKALAALFPEFDEERLIKDFTGKRKFVWLRRKLSPEQVQAVFDIGDPGLLFGPREMRLYPNGRLAAHVLGGASFGREGVHSAEIIGVAGIEKAYDDYLRDPTLEGKPLVLSLDLSVQAAVAEVLEGGMRMMNAKAASAVIMDIHTGEIIALVSLPDFDPNDRPDPPVSGSPSDSPLFNRVAQGVYELGSTFKIFAVAQALEEGLVNENTMVDTKGPMRWGKFTIRDFHNYGPQLSVRDVIVKSSNIGTAHIALMFGAEKQRAFLAKLGLLEPTKVELAEAPYIKPLLPKNWSELSLMTISYGHGLSATPLHLAAAYASILNGGTKVTPTLLKQDAVIQGERIVSERVSALARSMLRDVVVRGTASFGEVPGYEVGGKTGTAEKTGPNGGYLDDKNITTFASVFPASDPEYVMIVSLDEPEETSGPEPRRTAGWTAVPVGAEIIRRAAPLLGLRPVLEQDGQGAVTRVSN